MKIPTTLILWLWALPAMLCAAPDQEIPASAEDWYRVEIGDLSAGWMSLRETRDGGRLISESSLQLRIRRGAVAVTMEMASRVVETDGGRPLRAWAKQVLGPAPVETRYEFLDGEILVTTRQGDRQSEERRPYPAGDWLTPGAAQAATLEKLESGAESFSFRTLDPQFGLDPVEISWELEERDVEVEALGRRFVTSRWKQTASYAPQLASQVYLDAGGRLVRSSMPMMGLTLVLTLAERREVLAERGAPELLVRTFIHPDRPIRDPRRTRRAVYELRTEAGEIPELPASGAQTVERLPADGAGSAVRITVDLDREGAPEPAASGDPEPADATYLRSSFLVDHENPDVRRLQEDAARPLAQRSQQAGPGERAEAFRAFVSRHLYDKNLELLLASAGEVARGRAGDCTEHSVLLAALLRADGIPSRVVAGLVYVDSFAGNEEVFGYHMWTQARVGGRWVDLDASFATAFDATHIAFATTALDDHESALRELAGVTSLIGNVKIRVVEAAGGREGRSGQGDRERREAAAGGQSR